MGKVIIKIWGDKNNIKVRNKEKKEIGITIHSFLCVLNKHPRPKDRDLDRDVLFDIFAYIAADKKWNGYDKRKTVVFLDGSEYEDKKTNLIERLAAGEKLFVISVYQTIGAGQNLQYPVPGALADSVVKINDRTLKNEKDFDAIYLDKPTNLIVPLSDNMEENEFVKYLFQISCSMPAGSSL